MSFEETVSSIDTTLKAILVALVSGNSAVAQLGEPEKKAPAAAKAKAAAAGKPTSESAGAVLDGHEPGTQYWMSEDNKDYYVTKPGEAKPPAEGIINVSAAYFSAKKAESEKKSSAAAPKKDVATVPTATPPADDASGVTFKQVVQGLTDLSNAPPPVGGRPAVMELLAKFLPGLAAADRKVPKLEALGKHAEILADVKATLAGDVPEVAADEDDPFA